MDDPFDFQNDAAWWLELECPVDEYVRPHNFVFDGLGDGTCTFTELNGVRCGIAKEDHESLPDYTRG